MEILFSPHRTMAVNLYVDRSQVPPVRGHPIRELQLRPVEPGPSYRMSMQMEGKSRANHVEVIINVDVRYRLLAGIHVYRVILESIIEALHTEAEMIGQHHV